MTHKSFLRFAKSARCTIAATACVALAACLLLSLPAIVVADEYPSRPIVLVHPYPPGGSGDFVTRLFADFLSKKLGGTIVVENKPGASTNIALEVVARANPDGYTLLLGTSQPMINMAFGPVPTVDPFTALAPIAMVAEMPFMIAANPGAGIGSAKEMVAKAKTERLTIGHAQFEGQIKLLKIATGAKLDAIPYRGGAASVLAGITGEVNLVGAYVPVLMSQIKAGKLRAVGVAAKTRVSVLPDVPTFAEQGFPGFETTVWYNFMAPKGTSKAILEKLTAASLAIAKDPEYVKKLRAAGGEPLPLNAKETEALMRSEKQKWAEVAKAKKD